MNKSFLILFLLFIAFVQGTNLQAQNLVPNCSFEDTILCPAGSLGHIDWCNEWHSAGTDQSSPDYYKDCGDYNSVPYNTLGFQYAATGNSYVGLLPFIKGDTIQNEKEFIGTQLLTPLVIGQQYFVSFKVNLAIDTFFDQSGYASNKTGVLFSTAEYNETHPAPINNFAHIYTDSIITDTANWVTISGWFTADSAYRYINVGNFFDEAHTDTIRIYNGSNLDNISYYFIDDVCVSIDSAKCSCVSSSSLIENKSAIPFTANYNSITGKIYIRITNPITEKIGIKIYDAIGHLQFESLLTDNVSEISVNHFSKGLYILNVQSKNKTFYQKLLIY